MSGRATVWSYVVTHPPLLPAYTDLAPYVVVVVALDEDPTLRMVGNVVAAEGAAINSVDPATVRIGEARARGVRTGRRRHAPPLGPSLT